MIFTVSQEGLDLMKKIKSITSATIAGIMALSICASYAGTWENNNVVNAGEQLGQTDFDDGVGLPWHICESETGKMEFELKGGKYQITIVNPGGASNGGEDRWDLRPDFQNMQWLHVRRSNSIPYKIYKIRRYLTR